MHQSRILVLRELSFGTHLTEELAHVIGISKTAMAHLLAKMRNDGQVFICGWERRPGNPAAIWAKGRRSDTPRPKGRTTTEYQRWRRQEHPEKVAAIQKRYRETHKEQIRAYENARRVERNAYRRKRRAEVRALRARASGNDVLSGL